MAVETSMPRGIGIPAGPRINDFAACSSKFILCCLASVVGPVVAEQLFFARLVFGNGGDEVRNVEEVLIVQIVGDAVAAPRAAAHAEGEIQPTVEAAAIGKSVRLVVRHPNPSGPLSNRAAWPPILMM